MLYLHTYFIRKQRRDKTTIQNFSFIGYVRQHSGTKNGQSNQQFA